MAIKQLHTRSWAILIMVVFFGILLFFTSQDRSRTRPKVRITHSTPVGGKVLDGVFHPTPVVLPDSFNLWRI